VRAAACIDSKNPFRPLKEASFRGRIFLFSRLVVAACPADFLRNRKVFIIDSPKQGIDFLKQVIDPLKQVIDSPKQVIDSLKQIIDSPKQVIDSLKQVIDSLKQVIDSLKQVIDSLKQVIDSLKGKRVLRALWKGEEKERMNINHILY
jgi:prefoldin subunit 5